MSRDAAAGPCMYRDRYFEIQRLLDEVLGTEDGDGAGEGIVADVALALTRAQQRGAVKVLRAMANEMATIGQTGWAIRLQGHANQIESGEVTL